MSETSIASRSSPGLLSSFNRKRRHTFDVDLKVERVLSLPYSTGKFFFKIRLLNGGNHVYICPLRFEVNENKVEFNQTDHFQVKMTSRVDNFTLDHCYCRISIRKEGRAGRSYEKIGYVDLDLASVAGCGDESKACLLNGYQQSNTNPANAYLEIRMKLNVLEGDHIFLRPTNDYSTMNIDHPSSFHRKKSSDPHHGSFIAVFFPIEHNEMSSLFSTNLDEAGGGKTLEIPSNGLTMNIPRVGHSRQESKSSVCSNQSSTITNVHYEKHLINDEETMSSSHSQSNRTISKRRNPFIDQFGDIQRRLQLTRVDVHQIVNQVIKENCQHIDQTNGYLCLMYNDDGTAHVGSSSTCSPPHSSLSKLIL